MSMCLKGLLEVYLFAKMNVLTSLKLKSIRQTKKFAANLMTGQVTFDSVRQKYHEMERFHLLLHFS